MAEIDRVFLSIDAHFKCFGNPQKYPDEMKKLTGTIVKCVMGSISRYSARKEEDRDKATEAMIEKAEGAISVLDAAADDVTNGALVEDVLVAAGWDVNDAKDIAKNPFVGEANDKVLCAGNFKKAATLAMIARRSLMPLKGEQPWDDDIDPAAALRDDDDPYSFSIFDTLVEPIQELLPPLYQLSTEGWTPSDEEACEAAAVKLDGDLRGVVKELVGVAEGEDALIVYLSKESTVASKLPTTYEGFPVTVQVIGGITPATALISKPTIGLSTMTQVVAALEADIEADAAKPEIFNPKINPTGIKCPLCKVKRGKACVTKAGNKARSIHNDRITKLETNALAKHLRGS